MIKWLVCCMVLIVSLQAKDEATKEFRVFPATSHYVGDYFAYGQNVEISGQVLGDVYVLGGQIVVDGWIEGDLLVLGGSVDLSGVVQGNVRMIGGQLLVSGEVKKSVSAVAGNVLILPCAIIGENAVVAAGNIDLGAHIGGEATIVASHARVACSIRESLYAYVGQIRLTSKSEIGGDLSYRSNSIAIVEDGARIRGEVYYSPSLVQGWIQGTWMQKLLVGSKVLASLMNFLYSFVVGLILIKLFPGNLETVLRHLNHHPWKALLFGCVLLVALPLVSLVLLMTILGVPFALTLIAANIIGFYTAKIYTIYWGAHFFAKKFKLHARKTLILSSGLVCYFLLTAIPFAGTLIAFLCMLFGVGAGVLAQTPHKTS